MPHRSFLSAWNFVWSQIWKLTLGLGVNLRRVDIIIVMVHSTLPGWHTPLIEVEIAFDFTKSYASMVSGQTFKWYGNRSDEIVAREFRKLVVVPKLVLGLLIVQKHSPRWCPLSSPVILFAFIQHNQNISNRIYFSWNIMDITVWYNIYNSTSNSQYWIL